MLRGEWGFLSRPEHVQRTARECLRMFKNVQRMSGERSERQNGVRMSRECPESVQRMCGECTEHVRRMSEE